MTYIHNKQSDKKKWLYATFRAATKAIPVQYTTDKIVNIEKKSKRNISDSFK